MASQYAEWNKQNDSEDEDEIEEDYYNNKEAILFLIESTPTMLDPEYGTLSPLGAELRSTQGAKATHARSKLEVCLRCAYAMMKRKVISAPRDSIGIVVFNTAETQVVEDTTIKNCLLVKDLQVATAESIKAMRDLLAELDENSSLLKEKYATNTGQNSISDAFGVASTLFLARVPKQSGRRIFFITDNDDPAKDSEQLIRAARFKLKDLLGNGYTFEPFFISATPARDFDLEKFYNTLIIAAGREENEEDLSPVVHGDLNASLDNLIANLRTKEATKRTAFSIPFLLADKFTIWVNGYNLIGEEKKRPPTKVDANSVEGAEVISKTKYTDTAHGASLDPKTDIKKYFQVGKDKYEEGIKATRVFFDEGGVRKVKAVGRSPGVKLLGFKPRKEYLKFHDTIRHSYFIYPNEEKYTGSTRTFSSLLATMLAKDVIGIASFLSRATSRPQMVLLLPQEEELSEQGQQITPSGIHLCQLPFADDVRPHGLESTVSVVIPGAPDADIDDDLPEQPAIDVAKQIIRKLNTPYEPDRNPNPALNYFYETIAALALDEDIPEPEDRTIPKYESINNLVGDSISELKKLIKEAAVDPSAQPVSKQKRRKSTPPPESAEAVAEFAQDLRTRGAKMKMNEIKEGLKLMNQKTAGIKADLMERAVEALRPRGFWADDDDREEKPKKKTKKKVKVQESEEEDLMDFGSEDENVS